MSKSKPVHVLLSEKAPVVLVHASWAMNIMNPQGPPSTDMDDDKMHTELKSPILENESLSEKVFGKRKRPYGGFKVNLQVLENKAKCLTTP